MKKYQEDNDQEFVIKKPWSRKAVIACAAVAFCAPVAAWYFYEYHYLPTKEIPLLTAEEGPTKIKPEKIDGALIPHMDKVVYDTLKPGHDATRHVSIMPEPEQPIEVSSAGSKDAIEDIIGKVLFENEPQAIPDSETVIPESIESQEKASPEPVKTLKIIPVEDQGVKVQQKIQKTQPCYKVQLVSVRTREIAEKEWERLKKLHHKVLNSLPFFVQKIDVKDRGVFYRLLAGRFPNSSSAKALCKKLAAAQQTCIVVKD